MSVEQTDALIVVRAITLDNNGNSVYIKRGPQANLEPDKLSLIGGEARGKEPEQAITERVAKELALTSEDKTTVLWLLATIITNLTTPDGQLVITYLFAVEINRDAETFQLRPQDKLPGKADLGPYTFNLAELSNPLTEKPDETTFGYGYAVEIILSGSGEFPERYGMLTVYEENAASFRKKIISKNNG